MIEPALTSILIVDDEPELRDVIARDFKRKGYQVFCADNGRRAFELVGRQKVDLVISDVRMPDGDGIELVRRLKEAVPKMPVVIFVTAYSDLTLEDAYDLGAHAVFSKPFDRAHFHETILRALAPLDELWAKSAVRVEVSATLELSFPSLDTAVKGRLVNIGRGGMFIALSERLPRIDDSVRFRIDLIEDFPLSQISGHGTVRWLRNEAIGPLSRGFGLEFSELAENGKQCVLEFLNNSKTRAFIPKN